MPHKPDVIDLADDDDNDEAEYDSIPLPDDIEAIENGRHGSVGEGQNGIDARQGLKEELAKIEAEVSIASEVTTDPSSSTASQARSLSFRSFAAI